MAFSEDLSVFFDTDDFAVEALYNSATTVNVLFDENYVDPFGVSGTRPAAWGRASDFVSPVGNPLVVNGTTYTIREREPQDDGAVVLLKLERA